MSRRRGARRPAPGAPAAAVLTVALSVGLAAAPAPTPGAAPRQSDEGAEVRDIEYVVRDITYTSRSLDNTERVEQSPEQTSVTLAADVLFEYDRADLTSAAAGRLDELADQLADLGPREVTIGGHTDDHGDTAYNQTLSEQRAQAVRAALEDRLDDGFTYAVTGHGETEPVTANANEDGSDNPEGRALNRRVEITFAS